MRRSTVLLGLAALAAALVLRAPAGAGQTASPPHFKTLAVTYLDTGEERTWEYLDNPTWTLPTQPNQLIHIKAIASQGYASDRLASECIRLKGTVQSWGRTTGTYHAPVQVLRDPNSDTFHLLIETPGFSQLRNVAASGDLVLLDVFGRESDRVTLRLNASTYDVRVLPIQRRGYNFYAEFATGALRLRGRQ